MSPASSGVLHGSVAGPRLGLTRLPAAGDVPAAAFANVMHQVEYRERHGLGASSVECGERRKLDSGVTTVDRSMVRKSRRTPSSKLLVLFHAPLAAETVTMGL